MAETASAITAHRSSAPRRLLARLTATMVVVAGAGGALALHGCRAEVVSIATVHTVRGDLLSAVTATGSLQPLRVADIRYDGQDLVRRLFVQEGDRVRAGQPLAEMDARALTLTRHRAQQELLRDETALNTARLAAERADKLAAAGLLARVDLEVARATAVSLAALVESQRIAIQQVDEQVARAVLRAPMDGQVLRVYVHEGEMLGSATAVANLGANADAKPTNTVMTVAAGRLLMYASVNAADLRGIRVAQRVEVAVEGLLDTTIVGRVTVIDLQPIVVNNVTSYRVTVGLISPDARFRIGLPATAMFLSTIASAALLVPTSAVFTTAEGESAVMVVPACETGGTCLLSLRPVEVISRNASAVAVRGPVRENEALVLDASQAPALVGTNVASLHIERQTFDANAETSRNAASTVRRPTPVQKGPPPKPWFARLTGL